MNHSRRLVVIAILVAGPSLAWGSAQSARTKRNALHYYEVRRYDKARSYFLALLAEGTPKERALARAYLAKPELQKKKPHQAKPRLEARFERSQKWLEAGIGAYKAGDYQTALRHFQAVQSRGNIDQQAVARYYLLAPEMLNLDSVIEEAEPDLEWEPDEPRPASSEALLHVNGALRSEAAYAIHDPHHLTKVRQVGYLAGSGHLNSMVSYKVSARGYYDAVFDLTDDYPPPVEEDQQTEAMLRDTYVDLSAGDWDARLGKQQIVWGEAVGLFYADVVNARDLREFVLPDFEFIRIPEWGGNLEYTLSGFHAEGVWLPVPEMNKIGRPGSEFAPPIPEIPGVPAAFAPEEKPEKTVENSEYGGRLSYRAAGWDIGAFYLRTWDKDPVYTRSIDPAGVTYTPVHPRLDIQGATLAKDFDSVILKGEFVYRRDKYFISTDLTSPTGVVAKDVIDYFAGIDYTFPYQIDLSLQLGQRLIPDYESDIYLEKDARTLFTLWLRRTFLRDRLEASGLVILDRPANDALLRPKLAYKWASNWRFIAGMDFFEGSANTPFGVYANRDRVYGEVRFDF